MTSLLVQVLLAVLLLPWILAVLLMLAVSRMRRDPGKRWQDFVTALGLLTLIYASARLNLWVTRHVKHSIDAQLWRTDIAFYIDPFAVVYFMQAHAALWYFMETLYVALAIVMAIAWLIEQNRTLRRAVAIAGVGGWIFSASFPAVGPHWYLDGYTVTMRHCFPAVEWSWALLLALNSHSRLRVPLWIYTGLLAIASILLGEHYLVDLIVALPYTFAVQGLAVHWPGMAAKFRPAMKQKAAGAPSTSAHDSLNPPLRSS
jgi:hypothetical protein